MNGFSAHLWNKSHVFVGRPLKRTTLTASLYTQPIYFTCCVCQEHLFRSRYCSLVAFLLPLPTLTTVFLCQQGISYKCLHLSSLQGLLPLIAYIQTFWRSILFPTDADVMTCHVTFVNDHNSSSELAIKHPKGIWGLNSAVHEYDCGRGLPTGGGDRLLAEAVLRSLPQAPPAQFGPESSVSGTGRSEGFFSALYNLSGKD